MHWPGWRRNARLSCMATVSTKSPPPEPLWCSKSGVRTYDRSSGRPPILESNQPASRTSLAEIQRAIVLVNSAAALLVSGFADSPLHAMQRAAQSIDSGAALSKLEKLAEFSR